MKRVLAKLDSLEKEIEELKELQRSAAPRLDKLKEEEEELQKKISSLKVREMRGEAVGAELDRLRGKMSNLHQKIREEVSLMEAFDDQIRPVEFERRRAYLEYCEQEYRQKVKDANKQLKEYLDARDQIEAVSRDYKTTRNRCNQLYARIGELRFEVKNVRNRDDLPQHAGYSFTDGRMRITPEMLRHEHKWQHFNGRGKK